MAGRAAQEQNLKIRRNRQNKKGNLYLNPMLAPRRARKYPHPYIVEVFVRFFDYVRGLDFQDQPDYEFMKSLFTEELKQLKHP